MERCVLLGILIIAVALPMAYFVKEAPEREAERKAAASPASMASASVVRGFTCWLLAACAPSGSRWHDTTSETVPGRDYHYTQFAAAKIISLYAMVSIVGRLLMGWLPDRSRKEVRHAFDLSAYRGAIPALFFAETPGALYVFAIIFGLG